MQLYRAAMARDHHQQQRVQRDADCKPKKIDEESRVHRIHSPMMIILPLPDIQFYLNQMAFGQNERSNSEGKPIGGLD